MSLVELMVGMLIGLIGIVIITHLYVTNEEYKRRLTSSGSAQSNGAIALYTLERELRMAGFGINHREALACQCNQILNPGCSHVQYYYDGVYTFPPHGSATGARNSLALYPVVITDMTNGPDSISIFYGSDNERIMPSSLQSAMTTASDTIKIDGTVGFEPRDTTLNDPGNLVVLQNGGLCAMYNITGVTDTELRHESTSKWNPAGGGTLPAPWGSGTRVYNLGSRPQWRAYSIKLLPGVNTGKLQLTDQMRVITEGAVSEDLMDGIFDLQAQYGLDINGDGIVDKWSKCITDHTDVAQARCPPPISGPPTAVEWARLIAVRLAVLARSEEWVKPSDGGTTCDATTTSNRPKWAGNHVLDNGVKLDFPSLDATGVLPSCYKYRVFETVVPLRNMLWRPS